MDSRYVPFVHKGILSVLYIVCIVEKKAKIADFSTFFCKKSLCAYVYAFFVVPSDAACWKAILISLCSNEFSNIPPKLRSLNAAHTQDHERHLQKNVNTYHILSPSIYKRASYEWQ